MSDEGADAFIFITAIIGVIFAWFQYKLVAKVSLTGGSNTLSNSGLDTSKLIVIYDAIRDGADSFLRAEYTICAYFIAAFGIIVLLMTSYVEKEFHIDQGGLTAISFVAGGITSIISGLIGMKVAVFANARTTIMAAGPNPWTDAFNTAFRAGSVMGFSLCGLSMLVLYVLAHLFAVHFKDWDVIGADGSVAVDVGGAAGGLLGRDLRVSGGWRGLAGRGTHAGFGAGARGAGRSPPRKSRGDRGPFQLGQKMAQTVAWCARSGAGGSPGWEPRSGRRRAQGATSRRGRCRA